MILRGAAAEEARSPAREERQDGPELDVSVADMGLCRAELWDAVSCGQVRGGPTSETSRATEEEPAGRAGDPPHLRYLTGRGVLYPDTVQYELAIEGRNYTIHLEKNRNLIGSGYTETHYTEDGKRVTTSPNKEHCFYHGQVEGVKDSSVSVGICSGISGFVRARQQVYLIEPLGQTEDGEHAVYRREHLKTSGRPGCGSSSNTSTLYDKDQVPGGLFRSRSWKSKPQAAGPERFVELFVVVDNAEYKKYGSSTRSRILEAVHHVDSLYRPLNIRVLLVGLEIWTYKDKIDVHTNSEVALDNFLLWRRVDLLQRIQHDNTQFVTGKDFDGDTVGLANKFAMCTENSGGVNQDHHDNSIGLASTIAHEMGHNFGLSHDALGCVCGPTYNSNNCIMTEKLKIILLLLLVSIYLAIYPDRRSSVSGVFQRLQCVAARRVHGASSAHLPVQTQLSEHHRVGASLHGNALVDPGEECDCGTVEECKNPCCDASTCRLTEGSQCAHGQCCDNCQLKQAGSVCRKSAGDCDLPEYCSGLSAVCPDDSFEMNGKPCDDRARGYCYNGRCPTRMSSTAGGFSDQANCDLERAIVGPDLCFNLNKNGQEGANCGRNKYGYTHCAVQDLKCGSMFCGGGGDSISGRRATFTVSGIECKVAVDDDKMRNIDMVPTGTRCGPDKVCIGNRCVNVSVYGSKEDCSKKCNNRGVCNHKKECHCDPGWSPPYCEVQYADLPQGQTGIIAAVCAVLSILLVITVVIAGLMCCKKDNMDNYTSKRKVYSAPDKLNPMFQESGVKDRPQISQPTFMESTATQACAPLIVTVTPSRPAPQPPKKPSPASPTSQTEPTKPQPPSKPLPPLNHTQNKAAKPNPPPVPPVKPSPPLAARIRPCPPPVPPAKPQLHRLT
ncbi:hypothetical protein L3Q82_010171 [Scortum barcoo]|uniref:Uncharacterized protein n=1 Tax=Scortum barcoo TaxID=214431 RepID=A0ACB8WAL7_9TELE|nr:hypothetical protein L3Q82_010171 [Scortum barcoo]